MIHFITSSRNKFEEIKSILPDVEQLDVDLPEIQEIDARVIVKMKLQEALNHKKSEFIVEDTSLYLECLSGLPGPLIKWFLKTIGINGLVEISEKLRNHKAEAKTVIGYARSHEEIYFFEGIIRGRIVSQQGDSGFEWDPVFLPDGYTKTFAEMDKDEKNRISMRRIAVNQLKEFLYHRQ